MFACSKAMMGTALKLLSAAVVQMQLMLYI